MTSHKGFAAFSSRPFRWIRQHFTLSRGLAPGFLWYEQGATASATTPLLEESTTSLLLHSGGVVSESGMTRFASLLAYQSPGHYIPKAKSFRGYHGEGGTKNTYLSVTTAITSPSMAYPLCPLSPGGASESPILTAAISSPLTWSSSPFSSWKSSLLASACLGPGRHQEKWSFPGYGRARLFSTLPSHASSSETSGHSAVKDHHSPSSHHSHSSSSSTPPSGESPRSTARHHKYQLLQEAQNGFERLRIHIKYALMRPIRPWTVDDVLALFSWAFGGTTLFILIGTTTFTSLILALANSLQFQGKGFEDLRN